MRWANYFRTESDVDFRQLWAGLGQEPVLVVLGGGFDPRASIGLANLLKVANAQVTIVRLELSDDSTDPVAAELAESNRVAIDRLASEHEAHLVDHPFPNVRARRSAGARISRDFHERGYLHDHQQVMVDVSGLPRSVFFPLIAGLFQSVESGAWLGDLHVAVSANPAADQSILSEGVDAPASLVGFPGPPDDEPWAARVWLPVLGEGRAEQLSVLFEDIGPDEVVPVLPFPAAYPRRGDNLVLEYRDLLVDRIAVDPRNFMYAAESNPFDLYREIHVLYQRYTAAL